MAKIKFDRVLDTAYTVSMAVQEHLDNKKEENMPSETTFERRRFTRDLKFKLTDEYGNDFEVTLEKDGVKIESDWRFRFTNPGQMDELIEYLKFTKTML